MQVEMIGRENILMQLITTTKPITKTNNMKELFKITIEFTRIFIGFILAITILVTFDIYYEVKRLIKTI